VSDQEQKNIEQLGEEAESAVDPARAAELTADVPEPHLPPQQPAPAPNPALAAAPRRGSSAVAWLALLLGLALAGGAGWSLLELRRREAALDGRLQQLETSREEKGASLQALAGVQATGERLQGQLEKGMGELRGEVAGQAGLLRTYETELARLRSEIAQQRTELEQQAALLARQGGELARIGASDRQSWMIAEAEYLLRLANQRLIMSADVTAATALLESADGILRELDDARMHTVRSAIAGDLAALRAVPRVDVEGLYVRLTALLEQADRLVIFRMPEEEAPQPEPGQQPAQWQQRLEKGYEEALLKLSDYLVIRRRDEPMETLLDPQLEGLVRQNLRLLLQQAQVALLSGEQSLYRESLQRAQQWVEEFFQTDEVAARALSGELAQLAGEKIAVALPDVSGSLQALRDALASGPDQGGAE
jgi:uroporphyrin-3 C-methyltransferase